MKINSTNNTNIPLNTSHKLTFCSLSRLLLGQTVAYRQFPRKTHSFFKYDYVQPRLFRTAYIMNYRYIYIIYSSTEAE